MSDENLDRYTELFLEEATEHIEELNQNLLILERDGFSREVIDAIFRTAHTLKSSSAFVGLENLSELAHKMEDLLQLLKDGKVDITTQLVNSFFHCLDRIKRVVHQVSEGKKSNESFADLIQELQDSLVASGYDSDKKSGASAPPPSSAAPVSSQPATPEGASMAPDMEEEEERQESNAFDIVLSPEETKLLADEAANTLVYDGFIRLDPDGPMKNVRFLLIIENLKRSGTVFKTSPEEDKFSNETTTFSFIYYGSMSREQVLKQVQLDQVIEVTLTEHELTLGDSIEPPKTSPQAEERSTEDTTIKTKNIKVSADKIDYLMNNVGELVIINSGLQKIYEDMFLIQGGSQLLTELKGKIDGAGRIARDLQSGIMKTRMIPVGLVFQRFTRPVRDLSQELNKEIDLVFHGEDTELDKNIIDALTEPLLHLCRNSIDHGTEMPEDRVAMGKKPRATLTLNAYQGGNNIFIEVKDDGRGLNKEKILEKARKSGIFAQDMEPGSDEEIYELIFQPGFSTAEAVSDISGRGVGMNVVKTMIQKFNGSIRVQSELGEGASFILSFPLTLAIISSILVGVGKETYAFPLSDVVENIKIHRDDITTLEGKDIFNLRGEILPIYRLASLMGLPFRETEEFPVVISNDGSRKVGFVVDELTQKKEIVIKSLEQNYRSVRALIGACLMGDGMIVMVLDVQGLLEMAHHKERNQLNMEEDQSLQILEAIESYNSQVEDFTQTYSTTVIETKQEVKQEAKQEVRELVGVGAGSEKRETGSGVSSPPPPPPVEPPSLGAPPVALEAPSESDSALISAPEPETPILDRSIPDAPDKDAEVEAALDRMEEDKEERREKGKGIHTEGSDAPIEISEEQYSNIYGVVNTGMINAGMVLSQLLGVSVEVSVPDLKVVDYSGLTEYLPETEIISVWLDTEGDFAAVVLLVFDQQTGYQASGDLMGLPRENWNAEGITRDDLKSVLSELTNIVGASILNAMANKTGINIMPSVPTFIFGQSEQLAEHFMAMKEGIETYKIIYISADFYREDMELLGRLFLILPGPSLQELLEKL